MSKYGIIAIGYNRPDSMHRLLYRLNEADYLGDSVLLIISIDNSGSNDTYNEANSFNWDHGDKVVHTYPERLGLRNHILKCGNYLNEYNLDAVAVFEDDIVPASSFYNYMKQTVGFYQRCNDIAGISLYSHKWNVNASLPFEPETSPFDTFFLQFAQSWGQIWLRDQWNDFFNWYQYEIEGVYTKSNNIPTNVSSWPKTSWLKYHIKYCIEKNKYFVYPYTSLATCFTDVGEHSSRQSTLFQVPLENNTKKNYRLPTLSDYQSVKYDAFFERQGIYEFLNLSDEDLCVDIYGSKPGTEKKYILSPNDYSLNIIDSFGLSYKPHEVNIKIRTKGFDLKLYENNDCVYAKPIRKKMLTTSLLYYLRPNVSTAKMIRIVTYKTQSKLKSGFNKIKKQIRRQLKK